MTAVAGDFYEYLPVDDDRAGFLVADVSGHGVPAALIASMIKVAAQSVAGVAHDPAELMRRLRDILSGQLQGQFVSAAYLWLDTNLIQRVILRPGILRCSAGTRPTARCPTSRATACSWESTSLPTIRYARFLSPPATASFFIPTDSVSLRRQRASHSVIGSSSRSCATIRPVPQPKCHCFCSRRCAPGSPPPLPNRTTSHSW